MADAFNPLPFFLVEANGSNLVFFRKTLDLLSSSSSFGAGMTVEPLKFVSSRSRLFPSILLLSFNSPGPDLASFSGSSTPTPKLEGYQIAVFKSEKEELGQGSPWRASHYFFQFLLKNFFGGRRCLLGLQPSRSSTVNLRK